MGKQYLIDSNTLIDYLSGKLHVAGMAFMDKIINEVPAISVITKIEVLGYNTTSEASQLLNSFVGDSLVIGLSDEIIDITIEVRKKHKIKIPDAIIAATSLALNSILITRNLKDFQTIKGVQCINPHEI
jgi:predicted nucleic acid-binding protein